MPKCIVRCLSGLSEPRSKSVAPTGRHLGRKQTVAYQFVVGACDKQRTAWNALNGETGPRIVQPNGNTRNSSTAVFMAVFIMCALLLVQQLRASTLCNCLVQLLHATASYNYFMRLLGETASRVGGLLLRR